MRRHTPPRDTDSWRKKRADDEVADFILSDMPIELLARRFFNDDTVGIDTLDAEQKDKFAEFLCKVSAVIAQHEIDTVGKTLKEGALREALDDAFSKCLRRHKELETEKSNLPYGHRM